MLYVTSNLTARLVKTSIEHLRSADLRTERNLRGEHLGNDRAPRRGYSTVCLNAATDSPPRSCLDLVATPNYLQFFFNHEGHDNL